MCQECYVEESRCTPLLHPLDCLTNHTQYICGTCGRCICIERDPQRGLQRWNFPFKSLEIAKMYLRTADATLKKPCGIYAIQSEKGRISYKIFADAQDVQAYLQKNPGKTCPSLSPAFIQETYQEYPHTQVRKLSPEEIVQYMREKQST